MSIAVISTALVQPAISKNQPSFHRPILFREEVKSKRGNMAKRKLQGQHRLAKREQIGHAAVSPRRPMTKTAGTMASVRVIRRRTQGAIRQCMNPSITTCPASVPVMVLLCPLAKRPTTNSRLAAAVPKSGASVR